MCCYFEFINNYPVSQYPPIANAKKETQGHSPF